MSRAKVNGVPAKWEPDKAQLNGKHTIPRETEW